MKDHEYDHLWNRWDYFSWFGLLDVAISEDKTKGELVDTPSRQIDASGNVGDFLDQIEGILIQVLEPKLNRQGAKWKDAGEYFQDTEELEEKYEIDDIYEKQLELEELIKKISQK